LISRDLAGDERGAAPVPIFEDFEKVHALALRENRQAPIVEKEKVEARDVFQHARVATVATRERQGFEQAGNALVEDGAAIPAGLVSQGAGEPAFSDAGRAGDQHILMAVDPISSDEPGQERAIDTAWRAKIDVLHAGVLTEGGELQARRHALGIALGGFAISHDADALLER
jgi:hypothetical protein